LNAVASNLLKGETGRLETREFMLGEANPADKHLLLAYATYAGSTMEVAQVIGEELASRGFRVDVKPVAQSLPLAGYQFVVLGSAIQYGTWLPEALEFAKQNRDILNRLPLALFSVHIQNLEEDPESRRLRLAYLDAVHESLQAKEEAFFAGRFNRRCAAKLLPGLLAWLMPDSDLRDWSSIRAWGQVVFDRQ
jgi:menaquinone-dependent protoporphyrinogen oxidase